MKIFLRWPLALASIVLVGSGLLFYSDFSLFLEELPDTADYVTLKVIASDINQDGHADKLIILEETDEAAARKGSDGERILQIYFGREAGYRKVVQHRRLILCKTCGGMMGDPLQSVTVQPPYLIFQYHGGVTSRWSAEYSFRYDGFDKNFYLHRISMTDFHFSNPEDAMRRAFTEKDFGKVRMTEFDYETSYGEENQTGVQHSRTATIYRDACAALTRTHFINRESMLLC